MPNCKQCNKWFSTRYKRVDGSSIPLTNRTRCFVCSPYVPRIKLSRCDKCGKQHTTKNCIRYNRHKKLKKVLIQYKGGKCQRCGYNKCDRALCFHHISDKEFVVSQSSKNIETIKQEVDKCVLLCHNCHMELHDGLWQLSSDMVK